MVDEPDDMIDGGSEPYNPHDPRDVAEHEAKLRAAAQSAEDIEARVIEARQNAFRRLFNPESADVRTVMDDFKPFCRGTSSAFDINERVHVLLTGRQEVYLRIMDYLYLPLAELIAKRKGE